MPRVFISYGRSDVEFVRRLGMDLSRLGADIWMDVEDIPAGIKWSSAIQEGLKTSEVMLVVISPASMASRNVEDEWQYFLDQNKPVIPVLWLPADIHFQLNRIQHINFNKLDYYTALEQLRTELGRQGFQLKRLDTLFPPGGQTPPRQPTAPVPVKRRTAWWVGSAVVGSVLVAAIVIVLLALRNGDDQEKGDQPTETETAQVTEVASEAAPMTEAATGSGDFPSGTEIIYTSALYAPDVEAIGEANVTIVTTDGTEEPESNTAMVTGFDPTWSPDGTLFAFVGSEYDDEGNELLRIYIVDENGDYYRLTDEIPGHSPTWSPDGTQIAFVSDVAGNQNIYVINADGSGLYGLTDDPANEFDPAWSPTGEHLAYVSDRDGDEDIYFLHWGGAEEPQLIIDNEADDQAPDWAPDGRELVYTSDQDGYQRMYVFNLDTFTSACIENCEDHDYSGQFAYYEPTWSPDGNWIAFVATETEDGLVHYRISAMTTDASDYRVLLDEGASEDRYFTYDKPDWRPR